MNTLPESNTAAGLTQAPALAGFEHISRYWDSQNNVYAARIKPGEFYVTAADEMITTVLGSCVSACIRDTQKDIGGMNHFMLPYGTGIGIEDSISAANRYGSFAMEHLINAILSHGGNRRNLEIKLVGGGRILDTLTDIGNSNIKFVKNYLRTETLPFAAEDLGGIYPRKVNYFPSSGRVLVKKLRGTSAAVAKQESGYLHSLLRQPMAGSIDLL